MPHLLQSQHIAIGRLAKLGYIANYLPFVNHIQSSKSSLQTPISAEITLRAAFLTFERRFARRLGSLSQLVFSDSLEKSLH